MTYLLDSDVVADWLRGRADAVQLVATLSSRALVISLITYGEIYEGIYGSRDPRTSEQGFVQFLRGVEVLPLNRRIMQRFARVRGELRRSGMIIGDPDLLIAATALHHGLTVVTRNVRHFERIPELTLYQSDAPTP
jgi:predicted nucleic acid-binding protein